MQELKLIKWSRKYQFYQNRNIEFVGINITGLNFLVSIFFFWNYITNLNVLVLIFFTDWNRTFFYFFFCFFSSYLFKNRKINSLHASSARHNASRRIKKKMCGINLCLYHYAMTNIFRVVIDKKNINKSRSIENESNYISHFIQWTKCYMSNNSNKF